MITSSSNQRVKHITALIQKTKVRREEKLFIVEGPRMFVEAPKSWMKEVYISESFQKKGAFANELAQIPHEVLSDDVFQRVSDTKTPQGILCVLKQPSYTLEDLFTKEKPLFVVLEDIQDPGNLGTIFRAGEGAGIQGVIMSHNTADVFNPKVIRSTMGSIYRMPFLYVDDLCSIIRELRDHKVMVYAAHLENSVWYDAPDYTQGTAFLIGNEGNGLKRETADATDSYIKIPMEGQVESLNAAIATSVLMYEAARQRRQS